MELSEAEKAEFAFQVKKKVDTAFFSGTADSGGALSYAGACQLTSLLEAEFKIRTGEIPTIIEGACLAARALRNPDKTKQKQQLRSGLGLMLATAGGLSMVWGVLWGLNLWMILGVILALHIPLLGPVAFFAASAAIVAGIHMHISAETGEALSARAHTLLLEAIANWADTKAANEKDLATRQIISRQQAERKIRPGKALLNIVTWPYRSTADFIDRPDAIQKTDEPESTDTKL